MNKFPTIAQIKDSPVAAPESNLHLQVVNYLKLQYPHILFRTDFAAGIKMTMGQAVKHKKLQKCKSWPDLFIAKKRNGFYGLFIELKKDISQVYLKDLVTLKADGHVKEQFEILQQLQAEGYLAVFGIGFQHTRRIIDDYLHEYIDDYVKE